MINWFFRYFINFNNSQWNEKYAQIYLEKFKILKGLKVCFPLKQSHDSCFSNINSQKLFISQKLHLHLQAIYFSSCPGDVDVSLAMMRKICLNFGRDEVESWW